MSTPTNVAVKVRNRLRTAEEVIGATVTLSRPGLAPPVSAVTNRAGIARLVTTGLADGACTISITPVHTTADPVGPLIAVGTAPDRIFRSVTIQATLASGNVSVATIAKSAAADGVVQLGRNPRVLVDLQPVWMRSPNHGARGVDATTIIIHHTGGPRIGPALNEFLGPVKSIHYMIDTDGQIVKMVQDSRRANHAGEARWNGSSNVNSSSIGIEIVNATGVYTEAQYAALVGLLDRLRTGVATLLAWNVIAHSDVGTNASGRLGRKSTDPGLEFQWARVERIGLGMRSIAGPFPTTIYGGFFGVLPTGSIRRNDNDASRRFDGAARPSVTGNPVRELQQDLTTIGYSVGTPDGDFGDKTHFAVMMLQEHFFAGGRGHKAPDGKVDAATAFLIKGVASAHP
jgi:N-acetylmuramoyl-L-alanine amidase